MKRAETGEASTGERDVAGGFASEWRTIPCDSNAARKGKRKVRRGRGGERLQWRTMRGVKGERRRWRKRRSPRSGSWMVGK